MTTHRPDPAATGIVPQPAVSPGRVSKEEE
jgi:hypothetical protein